jgi:hypothetical protein
LKTPNEDDEARGAGRIFDEARALRRCPHLRRMRLSSESCNHPNEPGVMSKLSTGFKTRLEYVLDQICAEARHGGSHEMRRFVAERLMAATEAGERSVDGLAEVARLALASFDETAPI